MQLFEQGRFALDDPAEKYLPELANLTVFESFDTATGAYKVRPAAKKVTIRHLFTHTSGLGYGFTSPIVRDFKPREGEKYAAGPLLFEPGHGVDLRHERRLARAAGREAFRQESGGLLPRAHLHAAGNARHVL